MLQIFSSFYFLITVLFPPAQFLDSVTLKDSNLSDSVKVEMLLEEVWLKRSNDPLSAIKIAKQAYIIAEKNSSSSLMAKANNFLGVVYTNIGANDLALDYHLDALKKSKEAGNRPEEGYAYNNIGGIYRVKNEFVPASENILTAINIFEELKDTAGLAYCFINMGRLHKSQDNFDKSLEYLNNALDLSKKINNEDLRARILIEIPDILFEKKQFIKAEEIYFELEELYKKINYLKGLAEVWNGLSELYYKEKKYNDALEFSNNSLEINRKILNESGEIENLNNISLIYMALKLNGTAGGYLAQSLKKASQINEPDPLINTYRTFYEFYKKTGDLSKSLYYYEKYNQLKDSVYTNEEMIKFNELESLIRIEKTEKENRILQNDLEQKITQRNYLITVTILVIVLVIIITFRFYENKKLSEELKQSNIVKDKFFSIIAHDLREPYNAVFGAVEMLRSGYDDLTDDEKKDIIKTIGRLVKTDFDLLENLLMWAKHHINFIEFLPVNINLKEIIDKNLSLFESNINKKSMSVFVDCPDDIQITADEQMLHTIFRNLILNAVKFSNNGGQVKITAVKKNNKTMITIEDDGIGMDEQTINNLFNIENKRPIRGTGGESGSGLGLILTKEFIERHKGTINVESELGKGSTFTITLREP